MGKGRKPCCEKSKVKRGAWSPGEDLKLITFIKNYGHGNWRALPKLAGLARCGKSCRLRWTNYLRPDLKRGNFTEEEEEAIINLHQTLGNKWSKIASNFPGRTDNEIKNLWNTRLKKRVAKQQDSAGATESKDSAATYSSSSTTTNQEKRKATESETKSDHHHHQMDTENGGAAKKPCVSGEDTQPIISSNSSSSSTNSSPAAMISLPDGSDEFGALLFEEFFPPANFDLTGDIPKPGANKPVEILFELDGDFWNFLDGLDPFEEHGENDSNGGHEKSSNLGEIENKKWIQYIENELGLEPTGNNAAEDDSGKTSNVEIPPEFNSEIGYYPLWPSL